jgi:membrane dipeptidase
MDRKPVRWEAHTCLPLHPAADFAPLERLRAAGVSYASINVGMDMNPLEQVMRVLGGFRERIAAQSGRYVLARGIDDVTLAQEEGRLAIGFDLEGSLPLLGMPAMVGLYKSLGVHQMHLAYNRSNEVAGGCHDEDLGLTALGREVVEAINRHGVLLDCAHTGERSSLEIMAQSTAPVIFSHANPRALVPHGRNITDEQIRACAATGGVVCISGVSAFLGVTDPNERAIAAHAAYVADLVGVEHTGIGMDFSAREDHLPTRPPGLDASYWWPPSAGYRRAADGSSSSRYADPETWNWMPAALAGVGFTEGEIAQVMGENMMRVARAVWS